MTSETFIVGCAIPEGERIVTVEDTYELGLHLDGRHSDVVPLRTGRPNVTRFKRFVEALGRRYSGTYADENQGGGVLPRVSALTAFSSPGPMAGMPTFITCTPQAEIMRASSTFSSSV